MIVAQFKLFSATIQLVTSITKKIRSAAKMQKKVKNKLIVASLRFI